MNENILEQFCYLRDKVIEKRYEILNEEQREAVLNNNRNLALIACPGAGKTTTLIRKVDYLVTFGNVYKSNIVPKGICNEDITFMRRYLNEGIINERIKYLLGYKGINPNNIIVITFTRASALTMKERYKRISSNKRSPFFGTLHGLFYKILKRHEGIINIIDSNKTYGLIKNVLTKYLEQISDEKVREVINSISLYKTNNVTFEEVNLNINKDIFKECYRIYEEYKDENNLMDFDDLQIKCRDLFIKNKRILNGYRRLFKYILVDEFQDCDEIQVDILKLLNENNSIFAVGDEDQCIYSFRGAKPECLVSFNEHFKDSLKLFLERNYRCPRSVVKISDNLIKNNKMRNDKNIYANKKQDTKINVVNYSDENREANDIALNILKLNEYDYKDTAVLFRTNIESRSIIDAFIRKKIPFKLLDREYNFFGHFICKDILSYLRLSIDTSDKVSFFRIINKPFRYISKINIEKLRYQADNKDCFEALKSIKDLPLFQMKSIDELKRDIQNLNKMSLSGAIHSVLMNLGYYDHLKEYSEKFKIDISELEEIVEEFKSASQEYNTIITFLSHVDEVSNIIKNKSQGNEDTVTLSTIHGVKGMEFKNIFLINCNEENIPHINSMDKNIEEERRLFYVAITRTIDNLWLCITNTFRGKNKSVSRFIHECKVYLNVKNEFKVGEKITHKGFGKGKIEYIDDKIIKIKFNDEITRSFDLITIYNNGLINKVQ